MVGDRHVFEFFLILMSGYPVSFSFAGTGLAGGRV
jgi:TRAP-type mannitol/chloroaromatic compound transport system permease large subunit